MTIKIPIVTLKIYIFVRLFLKHCMKERPECVFTLKAVLNYYIIDNFTYRVTKGSHKKAKSKTVDCTGSGPI